ELESPATIGLQSGTSWTDISVAGDRVFLAGMMSGISVIDIEDRQQPRQMLNRPLPAPGALSVAATAGFVFAGSDVGPVTVIRTRSGLPQSIGLPAESELWLTNGPVTLELAASTTSGQVPTFRLFDGPAVLSGNQLTITNNGIVYGEATVPGNEQFFEARMEWFIRAQKLAQSITFRPPAIFGLARGSLPLVATASSGLPVTLELVSGPGTLEGNRLTLSAVGTVVVRAVQAGDIAYLPAESVVREIQILDLPEIVVQPSPTNVASGSPAVLEVVATGNGVLAFEWYRDGVRLPGETSANLTRSTVGSADMGLYHAVVRNDSGGAVTSSVVSLTVDLPGSEVILRPRGSIPHRAQPTSSNPGRIEVQGRHAFVVNQALPALQIVDIKDPDFPTPITTVPLLSTLRQDLALKDGYLLLAEREKGIGILDVRNPEKPIRLSSYRFPQNRADVVTLNVVGNRAFVGNGSYGFAVLNVEDPTRPVMISALDTSGLAAGIWLQDQWAYVADWASGLKVIDIANLSTPRLVGRYPAQDATVYYYDLVGRGGYAYLTREFSGLLTFDVRQPLAPSSVQTNRGSIFGLELAGQTLFAADNATQAGAQQTRGIRLFDVSRPEAPQDIGRFAEWGRVDGIRLDGNRLLVTGDRFGIVDLEFPRRAPALVIEPRSQVVRPGEVLSLTSMAIGGEPLSYQWWHRGSPLLDATNRTLALGRITLANAGDYVIKVHNPWGTVESAPAQLRFDQRLTWDLIETNTLLRLQQPYPLTATSDSGLPITYQILSGPAMLADGQLVVTNVGAVRLAATQPGDEVFLPISRDWTFNIGEVQFRERGVWPEFTPGDAVAVDVEGTVAIVAVRESGLLALDISDPAKPRLRGQYSGQGEWTDLQVAEGIAYAMNSVLGLVIVDFQDPAHPLLRSTIGGSRTEGRVTVANRIAYLHGPGSELQLVDVSDPAAPTLLSTNPNVYSLDDLVVRGSRVLATGLIALGQILDVSDPRNPTRVSVIEASTPGVSIAAHDDWVAVARGEAGLDILRLETDDTLERLAHLDLPNGASHVEWKGQYLFVASGPDGLVIVDATDHAQPKVVTNTDSELLTRAGSFRIIGDHAYVTDWSRGLVIYDIQVPPSPHELGWFPTAIGGVGIRVQGNYAYLLTGRSGLTVLDVSDPDRPIRIGGVPSRNRSLSTVGNSVSVGGNRVYFADGDAGVQIVDAANPEELVPIGVVAGASLAVVATDAALHIADAASTIRTWDVTDPSNPIVLGTAPFQVRDFQVSGNRRISAGIRNLWVEDVTVPDNPITLGTATLQSVNLTSIDVAGSRVFLGSSFGSLIAANVSNPQSPFEESRLNNLGQFS
ncbi:MAG TPA: hypothetical protein DCE44_05730, partial [Verrucomicrobiales bacterium]|nr:hypothetical protein [Verrucomicrobiales bacterium]